MSDDWSTVPALALPFPLALLVDLAADLAADLALDLGSYSDSPAESVEDAGELITLPFLREDPSALDPSFGAGPLTADVGPDFGGKSTAGRSPYSADSISDSSEDSSSSSTSPPSRIPLAMLGAPPGLEAEGPDAVWLPPTRSLIFVPLTPLTRCPPLLLSAIAPPDESSCSRLMSDSEAD